jgi:multicomponent Na+:H+ antiporter subunit B
MMVRKFFVFLFLGGLAGVFYRILSEFVPLPELKGVAEHYVSNGVSELGSANLVTGIVVTYRGLDTLGEVTILFLTSSIIGFFLKKSEDNYFRKLRVSSEILRTASLILFPVLILFGAYIFINGHLTPGGGFQGGAVIASGVALLLLADPKRYVSHAFLSVLESISGFVYVSAGIIGILVGGGFLDTRVLPLGPTGALLSAGLIPVIYIFIGLKVGSELSSIIVKMQEIQREE